jgi:hypothetical protein
MKGGGQERKKEKDWSINMRKVGRKRGITPSVVQYDPMRKEEEGDETTGQFA